MSARPLLSAEDIRHAHQAGLTCLPVPPGAIVTQQAREDARHFGITLTDGPASGTAAPVVPAPVVPAPVASAPAVPAPVASATSEQIASLLATGKALLDMAAQLSGKAVPTAQAAPAQAAPAQAMPAEKSGCGCGCQSSTDALFDQVRREVLAALPSSTDPARVDDIIRATLAGFKADGGGCVHCPRREAEKAASAAAAGSWLQEANGVRRVDAKALNFDLAKPAMAGIMQVLGGEGPQAGYLRMDGGRLDWTFDSSEVLVVLQGELRFSLGGTLFRAGAGDLCSFPAGARVSFEADGPVCCATVGL